MSDFQFNGGHFLIVSVVAVIAFVAGIIIGYFVRDDMINERRRRLNPISGNPAGK